MPAFRVVPITGGLFGKVPQGLFPSLRMGFGTATRSVMDAHPEAAFRPNPHLPGLESPLSSSRSPTRQVGRVQWTRTRCLSLSTSICIKDRREVQVEI